MKCLDLFCGTKSIGAAFEREGFDVTTLDIHSLFNPDIRIDILDWEPKGHFDVVWASPPCECFSVASIGHHWQGGNRAYIPKDDGARLSIKLVEKAKKIIQHYNPVFWFIENPRDVLRNLPIMQGLPRTTITYCQYGDTRMKPTDIWGVFPRGMPIWKCNYGDKCHVAAPRGSKTGTQGLKDATERGIIPKDFCDLLAKFCKLELIRMERTKMKPLEVY